MLWNLDIMAPQCRRVRPLLNRGNRPWNAGTASQCQCESLLHVDTGIPAPHAQARCGTHHHHLVCHGAKVSMPGSGIYATSKAAITGFILYGRH